MTDLTLSDYQALAEFRYQIRKYLHFSEQTIHAGGLERQQYLFMLAIKGVPDGSRPRIRDIADRMLIQHHSAVELVNRLEVGGYVRRQRAQEDKREVLLELTSKGERVLHELVHRHYKELRTAGQTLVAALQSVTAGKRKIVKEKTASAGNNHRG
jgi:DNA-binding MarR family transcriptional regulator